MAKKPKEDGPKAPEDFDTIQSLKKYADTLDPESREQLYFYVGTFFDLGQVYGCGFLKPSVCDEFRKIKDYFRDKTREAGAEKV